MALTRGFVSGLLLSSLVMRSPAFPGPWGPRPLVALVPVLAAFAFAGLVWFADRESPAPSPMAVTALKPVEGSVAAEALLPIEVVYGVPTERTLHLWRPGR